MNTLATFDNDATEKIRQALTAKHAQLAQHHLPTSHRSSTARNYDSGIVALGQFMTAQAAALPTRSILELWRDAMLNEGKAVSTVNARLSASRKLLRGVADDSTDLTAKMVLRDWSNVSDAKAIAVSAADKMEADFGRRLTLNSLQGMINSIPTDNLKGLRDRALIAVMAGCGLRVGEAVKLTMRELFGTVNEKGQRGVLVKNGKHNKRRVVVMGAESSWVINAVEAYTGALGLSVLEHPDAPIFRGIKRVQAGGYVSTAKRLSERGAQRAVETYVAEYEGNMVSVNAHDLRRSYAKISKMSGMGWDALRDNMGHSSITITEKYVGRDIDWSQRVPNWTVKIL